ncbi:2-dehydro-3-deoxy-6-phosphogalactonate aldolase [Roseateles paludis]|jgi:2-dehydro-3-deoxyphosphogalactonate aldolase|uniref:2-dehydro-3-deoxy-6-phosphogalactonate aldolase n=1 Tax=Roseateles paludis TaxID=3145238 RepID=A0ABV0G2T9_9BURK
MPTPACPAFDAAWAALPLVAILRGVRPDEAADIGQALYAEGFRLIEVPVNSPEALASVEALHAALPPDAVLGAGTVLDAALLAPLRAAGARLVVMPHTAPGLIRAARDAGLVCIPGAATPSEVFAALEAGADTVKLFPAELVSPAVVKALRAVLPASVRLLPVGGITPASMAAYRAAGADGFGLGGALYRPGQNATEIARQAREFVSAWRG